MFVILVLTPSALRNVLKNKEQSFTGNLVDKKRRKPKINEEY